MIVVLSPQQVVVVLSPQSDDDCPDGSEHGSFKKTSVEQGLRSSKNSKLRTRHGYQNSGIRLITM